MHISDKNLLQFLSFLSFCCLQLKVIPFQKDVFVVSCDLVTDIALHHLADIHRSHDSTLSAFLAPVPQTSVDREAASNPKAKKKTDSTGVKYCSVVCILLFPYYWLVKSLCVNLDIDM